MRDRTTTPLLLLVSLCPVLGMIDYCRNHTFDRPTNSEALHFSKENSDREFGIYDKFKCLHCCSHGYRSIEWFKNGQPYPWPTDVSTLIIHPESGNQTICSQQSTPVDSGRYWCIARNDTHFLRHEVLLQISGPSISMGWPKTTYRPRDETAEPGDSVRFYCEAFVGTIDLPDFQSEITWVRYDLNESFVDGERILQEAIFREEKRVLGSYLRFNRVLPEDYGEYTCKVRNLGDQVVKLSAWLSRRAAASGENPKGERFWLLLPLSGLLLTASASVVCLLRFSRAPGTPAPPADGARKDVLVIYHENDEREALKTVSAMQGRSYSLHPLLSTSQLGEDDLKAKANSHGSVLALIGPGLVDWSCEGVHLFIQSLLRIHFTVTCVFLQALPKARTESTEWDLLKDSLSRIHCIDRTSCGWTFWNTFRGFSWGKKKPRAIGRSSQTLI